jgi:hypothetical protein
MKMVEQLVWISACDPPDDDIMVLVYGPNMSEAVWMGYKDGDYWREPNGSMLADVHYWAELPKGPDQC